MINRNAPELRELVLRILLAAGADERNAEWVADHLVSANVSGVDTHGVWHLPGYVGAIRSGELVPTAWPEVVSETSTGALVSGNWTFGHVAARFAMEAAIAKARQQNVAVVSLVRANHIGRLGEYAEMAAAQEMIATIWAGGLGEEEPVAVPYGGRKRALHTNPLAMGFPGGDEPPIVVDYATTAMSGVKVLNAYRRHEQLPPGSIVDVDGNPTTDPAAFFAGGAYSPFGGHKGYALMLAVEFMGRILAGADAYADPEQGCNGLRHQGVTMIVIRADVFQPFPTYAGRAAEFVRRIRAVPPAPGFDEVLVPGDREARTRVTREREGIPIADDVWQSIVDLAQSLGVKGV